MNHRECLILHCKESGVGPAGLHNTVVLFSQQHLSQSTVTIKCTFSSGNGEEKQENPLLLYFLWPKTLGLDGQLIGLCCWLCLCVCKHICINQAVLLCWAPSASSYTWICFAIIISVLRCIPTYYSYSGQLQGPPVWLTYRILKPTRMTKGEVPKKQSLITSGLRGCCCCHSLMWWGSVKKSMMI